MLWFSCALLPCEETQYVMFLEIHMRFYGNCSNGTWLTMYFTCVLQVCKHPRPVQDSHYSSLADPPEILHKTNSCYTENLGLSLFESEFYISLLIYKYIQTHFLFGHCCHIAHTFSLYRGGFFGLDLRWICKI